MTELDAHDRALLARLQIDARATAEALAADIGLSPASVHRRIKRLRDERVIRAEVAIVDPKAVGAVMTFIVSVEMERERADLMDEFRKRMRAAPEVQQCYYVTGEADFVLIVKARDLAEYERFTREVFFDNSNVRKFNTMLVMSDVKASLAIPV